MILENGILIKQETGKKLKTKIKDLSYPERVRDAVTKNPCYGLFLETFTGTECTYHRDRVLP